MFISDFDVTAFSKSIGKSIFFAGEHTDPLYYGSLHAAHNSGKRVLRELLNSIE
jgi:hypothetical protein